MNKVGGIYMSNRNRSKQQRENEKKRLEQQKLLLEMKKEITSLENDIKYSKFKNFKISTIKNLKISLRATQLVAPYVLTAGIMAGVCKLITGGLPFYSGDTLKIYSNVMEEFDSLGNIRCEQQYDSFENSDNLLRYYTQWRQDENGFYTRFVETYELKEITEEEILELFDKENLQLTDIFGEPTSKIKETNNNLTEEEINEKDYLQAIIYNKDIDDFIIHKESMDENIAETVLYVLLTALAEVLPWFIRRDFSNFDFANCVDDIKRKYKSVDIDELTKKLEIRRDNYNRLVR